MAQTHDDEQSEKCTVSADIETLLLPGGEIQRVSPSLISSGRCLGDLIVLFYH